MIGPRESCSAEELCFGARFGLATLATWRLGHLLAEEDGPGSVVVRVRERLGPSALGELMDCFYCLSVWISAPLSIAIAPRRRDQPLVWLALSGAACLLERATTERPTATVNQSQEGGSDVLWQQAECIEG